MPEPSILTEGCDGVIVTVKVVPGSSRTEWVGLHGSMYKIKIAAPPEKGKANKMLISFLSRELDMNKNAIQIKYGTASCVKKILLRGVTRQDVEAYFG